MMGIIFGSIIIFFLIAAENSFAKRRNGKEDNTVGIVTSVAYGVIIAAIHMATKHAVSLGKAAGVMPIGWTILCVCFTGLCVGGLYYLARRWRVQGSKFLELVSFAIALVCTHLVAMQTTTAWSTITTNGFLSRLIGWFMFPISVFALGTILVDFFKNKYEQTEESGYKAAALITTIVAALVILVSAIVALPDWNPKPVVPENDSEDEFAISDYVDDDDLEWDDEEEIAEPDWGFYNLSLQDDGDADNDFNFGWNPWDKEKDPSWYGEDFRTRLANDPAFAAASMAWVDVHCRTRFIGKFYDECEHEWDAAINATKEAFMADQDLYDRTLQAFLAFLDTTDMEIRYAKSGIEDQMFQNPYTADGVPDVIVMKTTQKDGHFLVFIFTLKGTKVEVPFRIECGYQPTNVEKAMDITPVPKPVPPTASGNNPPEPTPTPTPTPTPKKDKTKGVQGELVGPNDDPGPGPDSNNGEGAEKSKFEEGPSSTDMTAKEYEEKMKEMKEVNSEQKQGGDSNTPSTPVKPKTNVDSNADKGTGNGDIDKPTEKKEAPSEVKNNKDNPSGEWGGPKD